MCPPELQMHSFYIKEFTLNNVDIEYELPGDTFDIIYH